MSTPMFLASPKQKHLLPTGIKLEKKSHPLVGTIYFLFKFKQKILKEFIDKSLTNRFICSTSSPYRALVLFIKKKDGSFQLCVDFHGLNKITKKDWYPLLLISDLLDSFHKTCIYTKIDLQYVYHLVHIAKENGWKTTFWTHYRAFKWSVMPFRLTNAPVTF